MQNLKIHKSDLIVKRNSEKKSDLKIKKLSRRLFIKISLMSLPVVKSINTLKVNKVDNEHCPPPQPSNTGGSCQTGGKVKTNPNEKTKSSVNLPAPGDGSKKAGGKGKENQKKES